MAYKIQIVKYEPKGGVVRAPLCVECELYEVLIDGAASGWGNTIILAHSAEEALEVFASVIEVVEVRK